jgi:replicative DNA helicase
MGLSKAQDIAITPPHNSESERAILGCVLMNQPSWLDASSLRASDFYEKAHQDLWSCLAHLAAGDVPFEQQAIIEVAKSRGLANINLLLLTKLMADACLPMKLDVHRRIVSNASKLRAARLVGDSLVEASLRGERPAAGVVGATIASLEALIDGGSGDDPVELKDALMSWMDGTARKMESDNKVELPTSLDMLDSLGGGWQRSDLIILAARPAMGKTGFALTTVRNLLKAGKRVYFASLEMSRGQLISRLVAMECRLPVDRVMRGELTGGEWQRVSSAMSVISEWDLIIDDTPNQHINTLSSHARRAHSKKPLDMIVADYFQLIDGRDGGNTNRDTELGFVSRSAKGLAKRLNIPFLMLAQLSRKVEERSSKRPQLSDLRETGNAEQDADIVAFLMRPEYYGLQLEDGGDSRGIALVIIGKHRNGPTAEFTCHFDGPTTSFNNEPRPILGAGSF